MSSQRRFESRVTAASDPYLIEVLFVEHLAEDEWIRYRGYLRFLVETQIDPRMKTHVDLSGVVQQTLLEAHQAAGSAQVPVTLPWLRRILANNLTDEIRRLHTDKRDIRRERSLVQALEQSSIRLEAILQDPAPGPAEQVLHQERVLQLANALDRLPEAQRQALVLQVWQQWSLAEIAVHLGRSTQAVAGLLKRGLRQLRDDLDSPGDDPQ